MNIDPIQVITYALLCTIGILFAHGTLQELAGWRVTWRLTDSAIGRLWLSLAVVFVMCIPTLATFPVWLYIATWLLCSVAFYVGMDRFVFGAIPHEVRQVAATNGAKTWVDNYKPRGYRWLNQRVVWAIG